MNILNQLSVDQITTNYVGKVIAFYSKNQSNWFNSDYTFYRVLSVDDKSITLQSDCGLIFTYTKESINQQIIVEANEQILSKHLYQLLKIETRINTINKWLCEFALV
jgi:hypothetical protein